MESIISKIRRRVSIQIKYLKAIVKYKEKERNGKVTCIIFSRDRAMQLETLLLSIRRYSLSAFPIYIQYSCSPNHRKSYGELKNNFKDVTFVEEGYFRETLFSLLKSIKLQYLFYLVDDQVFIREFDVKELGNRVGKKVFGSMRLGKTISNFGIKDKELHPKYKEVDGILEWRWRENKHENDWGYQFSVDGTIYRTIDVLRCTLSIPFKAPNSYEANMNSVMMYKMNNKGVSYVLPVVINLIINASRQEQGYEQCEAGEYSADDLLKMREEGRRFDLDKIAAIPYKSCHHIISNINDILENA